MKTPTYLLDREEFQRWMDHPVTVEFRSYLRDRQMALMQAWGRGVSLPVETQAQAVLLGQLVELNFEMIEREYRDEPEASDE